MDSHTDKSHKFVCTFVIIYASIHLLIKKSSTHTLIYIHKYTKYTHIYIYIYIYVCVCVCV